MKTNEQIAVEHYFYTRYPAERYELKNFYTIEDIFSNNSNRLYVIEFIDLKMKYSKTLELQVKENDLFNFKFQSHERRS